MVITYEVLNEDALPLLEQFERMLLLRRVSKNGTKNGAKPQKSTPSDKTSAKEKLQRIVQNQSVASVKPAKKAAVPLRKKSLAGSLSPETAQKLREHVETIRHEWEHRI